MSRIMRVVGGVAVMLGAATTVAGQDRGVVIQGLGGGYSHVQNLNGTGAPTHWNTGFNADLSVGYQVNKFVAFHADVGMARNKMIGAPSLATGSTFNRFFYGGHVEVRYPTKNVSPFLFAGGGGMTIDDREKTGLDTFTKPAGMFGAGLEVPFPNSSVALMLQGKGYVFNWDRAGFNRTQFDVSYAVGLAYRFGAN